MRFVNLNVSKSLKARYQCAHNSSIYMHAYEGGRSLSPCITDSETDAEHHNRLCIWIYINSHAVPKMHGKHSQVKHALSVHVFG